MTNEEIELLKHMVGAGDSVERKDHGFRNYCCVSVGSQQVETMKALVFRGLVKQGKTSLDLIYFHATEEGCEAIGLSDFATKRAMNEKT